MATEEAYFRDQMDKAIKEAKLYKQRVEQLEKENLALKKSVYDLSARLSITVSGGRAGGAAGRKFPHFAIESLEEQQQQCSPPALLSSGVGAFASPTVGGVLHGAGIADSAAVTSVLSSDPGDVHTIRSQPSSLPRTLQQQSQLQQQQQSLQQSAMAINAITRPTSAPSSEFEQTSVLPSASTNSYQATLSKSKYFHFKYDLKGHTGAVYCAQFSPCGKFLASGSFDKTARVWDVMSTQSELLCLRSHTLNISDLAWSMDSTELLTGAYDNTCRTWDVESGKQSAAYDTEGFVQCVAYNPQNTNYLFYGTSRKVLSLIDRRRPDASLIVRNDAMVNTMYVYQTGSTVLTGDSAGCLKTWDIRFANQCIQSTLNEPARKPISHIATCRQNPEEEEPRYLAVNSYDNIIRVYDRGMDPPKTSLRLLHVLAGHKNKNWPIKSSFYQGPLIPQLKRSQSQENIYGTDALDVHDSPHSYRSKNTLLDKMLLLATGSSDSYAFVYSMSAWPAAASQPAVSLVNSGNPTLAAADPFSSIMPPSATPLILNDCATTVGAPATEQSAQQQLQSSSSSLQFQTDLQQQHASQQQQQQSQTTTTQPQAFHHLQPAYEIVQKLEGHSDRVYCTAFHPHDILLASCSADSTIKIWKGRSLSQ